MSTSLLTKLHEYFGCTVLDSCFCKDVFLEQVAYFLQTSALIPHFVTLSEKCNSSESISSVNLYHPLNDDSDHLRLLRLLIKLSEDLHNQLTSYLEPFCDSDFQILMNDGMIFSEIQDVVASLLISIDAEVLLQPLWYTYLCLELESAEADTEESNIFSTVICPDVTGEKMQVLSLARNFTHNNSLVNWNNLYRRLCIPYTKEALLYRTKLLCSENYSERFLSSIIKYKDCILKEVFLPRLFSSKCDTLDISLELSDVVVYSAFYSVHKPDMFSLVIEYPDSVAALMDLGKCLDHLPVRQDLIAHLTKEIRHRLLHPGVHTEQILAAYNYLVRALRLIDNTFLVQDIVCEPVSACLRQREDAVRCIVDKLISGPESDTGDDEVKTEEYADTTTELHQELLLPKPLEVESLDGGEESDTDIVFEDPPFDSEVDTVNLSNKNFVWDNDWKADPIEALYQGGGSWRRKLDLLSMLVSIYGSKKAFLVEYKQLLSQRLLRQRSFHTTRELRNLELLKLRFGEQNLHECEVMLKDIRDSKRIASLVSESAASASSKGKHTEQTDKLNSPGSVTVTSNSNTTTTTDSDNIQNKDSVSDIKTLPTVVSASGSITTVASPSNKNIIFPLSAYILSIHYWPELLDVSFKVPEAFRPVFEHYEKCFQCHKGNRTLNWMHKLGLVNIDLTLGKRTIKIDVTPLQASIIYLFTKQRAWCIRDLAQKLETQISSIRSSLCMFIQLGFLRPLNSQNSNSMRTLDTLEAYEVCDETDTSGGGGGGGEKSTDADRLTPSHDPGKVVDSPAIETASNWIFSSEDNSDAIVTSVKDRKEKELQVFWSYITAMLTNLGSLSLDRIHSMLRMFALGSTSSLEFSRDELRKFLDRKIREGRLGCDGDIYKLLSPDV
uniref:Anaphase-promoting complex subunit 2 n=1 Tax=Trichobilharzia regenti TaxID=157069 RepID=A0AA85JQ27_TRIRE|nr:unnamed protein product [Trichobilharzia regenti]